MVSEEPTCEIDRAWRRLLRQWQTSANNWNDQEREQLDVSVWSPLSNQVSLTCELLTELRRLVEQARASVC